MHCPLEQLPKLAVEAALESGMVYHWNSETKLRISERNEMKISELELASVGGDENKLRFRQLLKMSIDELELSTDIVSCLKKAKINSLKELLQKDEKSLRALPGMTPEMFVELSKPVANLGLQFGMVETEKE